MDRRFDSRSAENPPLQPQRVVLLVMILGAVAALVGAVLSSYRPRDASDGRPAEVASEGIASRGTGRPETDPAIGAVPAGLFFRAGTLRTRPALPTVVAADPSEIRLASPGRAVARLAGRRLAGVTGVKVVAADGAPMPGMGARLLSSGEAAGGGALTVEISTVEGVTAGRYGLQLDTGAGGIYVPMEVARIEVEGGP